MSEMNPTGLYGELDYQNLALCSQIIGSYQMLWSVDRQKLISVSSPCLNIFNTYLLLSPAGEVVSAASIAACKTRMTKAIAELAKELGENEKFIYVNKQDVRDASQFCLSDYLVKNFYISRSRNGRHHQSFVYEKCDPKHVLSHPFTIASIRDTRKRLGKANTDDMLDPIQVAYRAACMKTVMNMIDFYIKQAAYSHVYAGNLMEVLGAWYCTWTPCRVYMNGLSAILSADTTDLKKTLTDYFHSREFLAHVHSDDCKIENVDEKALIENLCRETEEFCSSDRFKTYVSSLAALRKMDRMMEPCMFDPWWMEERLKL